ncbi:MAG: hypothetical protein KGI35_03490 [Burkholderiales bacterium]|nr:hypothetical protein [Burkholderiales bacterium]
MQVELRCDLQHGAELPGELEAAVDERAFVLAQARGVEAGEPARDREIALGIERKMAPRAQFGRTCTRVGFVDGRNAVAQGGGEPQLQARLRQLELHALRLDVTAEREPARKPGRIQARVQALQVEPARCQRERELSVLHAAAPGEAAGVSEIEHRVFDLEIRRNAPHRCAQASEGQAVLIERAGQAVGQLDEAGELAARVGGEVGFAGQHRGGRGLHPRARLEVLQLQLERGERLGIERRQHQPCRGACLARPGVELRNRIDDGTPELCGRTVVAVLERTQVDLAREREGCTGPDPDVGLDRAVSSCERFHFGAQPVAVAGERCGEMVQIEPSRVGLEREVVDPECVDRKRQWGPQRPGRRARLARLREPQAHVPGAHRIDRDAPCEQAERAPLHVRVVDLELAERTFDLQFADLDRAQQRAAQMVIVQPAARMRCSTLGAPTEGLLARERPDSGARQRDDEACREGPLFHAPPSLVRCPHFMARITTPRRAATNPSSRPSRAARGFARGLCSA